MLVIMYLFRSQSNRSRNFCNFRGVAGLELLAMELKMGGKLTCRQLSFENVNVNFRTVHLSDTFKVTYMRATQLVNMSNTQGYVLCYGFVIIYFVF